MVKTSAKSLTDAAILVRVSCSLWGNRKVENELAEETARSQKAQSGMFHTTKRLVSRVVLRDVYIAFAHFKRHFFMQTLPWDDSGYRLLPSTNHLEFVNESRKLREDAIRQVEKFLKLYPRLRTGAKTQLGRAFRESDYPTEASLRHRFAAEIHFMPIPDTADIRIDLPAAELKRVTSDIDGEVKRCLHRASQDLFERLYRVVLSMRDRLKEYEVVEKGKKRKVSNAFRDSVIGNVKDLCELLPKLNVLEDANLAKLVDEVTKTFAGQEPEVLRENDAHRAAIVAKADDVLARMADYVGEATRAKVA